MSKIPQSCSPVNARREFEVLLIEAEATLRRTIEVRLTALLMAVVHHVVGRRYHHRRKQVSWRLRGNHFGGDAWILSLALQGQAFLGGGGIMRTAAQDHP